MHVHGSSDTPHFCFDRVNSRQLHLLLPPVWHVKPQIHRARACLSVMAMIRRKTQPELQATPSLRIHLGATPVYESTRESQSVGSLVGDRRRGLAIPLNQMQPTCCIDNSRNVTWPQRKGSLLEGSLHITPSKVAQVSVLASTAAVGLGDGQGAKRGLAALNARLVALDNLASLFFGSSDFSLSKGA